MKVHGLKLLGLSLLAAFGMAGAQGSAQAAEWVKEGKTFVELEIEEESASGTVGEGELLTAGGVKIACKSGHVKGTLLPGGTATFHVLFLECSTPGNPHCYVEESLVVDDNAILATGKGTVVLNGANHYLLVEGLGANAKFTLFVIGDDGTELCLLSEGGEPTSYEITGRTVLALPDILALQTTHAVSALVPATLSELFPEDKLFLNQEEAHLSGTSATVHLGGPALAPESWPSWRIL